MAEIERERAKAQELMEEARKLRDGYLERKKNGDQEVLSLLLETLILASGALHFVKGVTFDTAQMH